MKTDDDAIEIPADILELHKALDEIQIPPVRALCELYGYGRVIQIAQLLFDEKMNKIIANAK